MVCASLRTCLDQISLLGSRRRAVGRCISDDGPLAHILNVPDASFQWLWPRRGHQERIMRAEVQQEAGVQLQGRHARHVKKRADMSQLDFRRHAKSHAAIC